MLTVSSLSRSGHARRRFEGDYIEQRCMRMTPRIKSMIAGDKRRRAV
jgi:hypothetical protein